jgi:hypothetical protein
VSEKLLCTHVTPKGSLVEVIHTTPDRVKSLTEVAELTGPIWRCHGCGDGSDKPLVNAAFGSPDQIVDQAAAGHAATCRH